LEDGDSSTYVGRFPLRIGKTIHCPAEGQILSIVQNTLLRQEEKPLEIGSFRFVPLPLWKINDGFPTIEQTMLGLNEISDNMSWRQECSIGGDKKSRSVDCPQAGRSIGIAIEARDRYDRALYSRDGAHERIVLNRRIGGSNSAYGGDSYKQPEANGPASTQAGGTLIHPNHPAASSLSPPIQHRRLNR
jgi:hypothetical protein